MLIQKRKKVLSSLLHRLTREIGIALTVSFFGSTDGTDKTIKIVAISFFKHKDAFQILDAKVSFMHFVRYASMHCTYTFEPKCMSNTQIHKMVLKLHKK